MKPADIFQGKEIESASHGAVRHPDVLYVSIDEACNQDCAFCVVKGANRGKFGSTSTLEVKSTIRKFVGDGGTGVIFTGGEPTLRDDLPEIIRYAGDLKNLRSLSVITNGIRLADDTYARALAASDANHKLSFCFSLHSHKEKTNKVLTRTKGALRKSLAGIRNILGYDKIVSVYHVITSRNYKDLVAFARFLHREYPAIRTVTFAYPFPQGNAVLNDWVFPRLGALRPYLLRALRFLEKNGYTVSIAQCGQFPLCVIPGFEEKVLVPLEESESRVSGVVGKRSFHEFEMASQEWVDQYKTNCSACEKCIERAYCQGVWKKYTDLFGFSGIRAITENTFSGNAIRVSLRNGQWKNNIMSRLRKDKMNLVMLTDFTDYAFGELIDILARNKFFAIVTYRHRVIYPSHR